MFQVGKFLKFNALKFEYVTGTNKTAFQKCLSDYNQQKKKNYKIFQGVFAFLWSCDFKFNIT